MDKLEKIIILFRGNNASSSICPMEKSLILSFNHNSVEIYYGKLFCFAYKIEKNSLYFCQWIIYILINTKM